MQYNQLYLQQNLTKHTYTDKKFKCTCRQRVTSHIHSHLYDRSKILSYDHGKMIQNVGLTGYMDDILLVYMQGMFLV